MPSWSDKKRRNKVRSDAKWDKISAIPIIRTLVALGCSEQDIGIILGVEGATIASWKQRYPDIFTAAEEGKKILKGRVFAEMIRAATGYEYKEQDIKYAIMVDPDGTERVDNSKKIITEHLKYQPGNAALLQFIIQNLMPQEFPRQPIVLEHNTLQLITNIEESRIQEFAGRLLELGTKKVESNVLELREDSNTERPASESGIPVSPPQLDG